jgi:hypothetical protein
VGYVYRTQEKIIDRVMQQENEIKETQQAVMMLVDSLGPLSEALTKLQLEKSGADLVEGIMEKTRVN